MLAKRFLSDEELENIESLCVKFGEVFPVLFPNENIPRKIHEFIFDVPRFASKHKTLGLLSEEEGESLHCSMNQHLRQLVCVRDPAQKLCLAVQRQELSNRSERSYLIKDKRKCTCQSFFKKGICPSCGAKK